MKVKTFGIGERVYVLDDVLRHPNMKIGDVSLSRAIVEGNFVSGTPNKKETCWDIDVTYHFSKSLPDIISAENVLDGKQHVFKTKKQALSYIKSKGLSLKKV